MNLAHSVPEVHDVAHSQPRLSSTQPRDFSANTSRPLSGGLRRYDSQLHDAANPALATGGENSQTEQAAAIPAGDFSPVLCASPRSSASEFSTLDGSMGPHGVDLTPPESPSRPTQSPVNIGRLSLDHGEQHSRRGRGLVNAAPSPSCKRAASKDLPRLPGRQSPGGKAPRNAQTPGTAKSPRSPAEIHIQARHSHLVRQNKFTARQRCPYYGVNSVKQKPYQVARDSGYESQLSRLNTLESDPHKQGVFPPSLQPVSMKGLPNGTGEFQGTRGDTRRTTGPVKYSGLILQPESSPISQDQLAAELKGIYAGLAMVEAKCIAVDAAQASDPTSKLGPEQWQALIALHRTLLYEHHDFLMATQHPSATPALRGLAIKHSMPARMWKHGIHAFLEVLRHRRPASQDYMLSFIYLAYQMISLLYETVPAFLDTWIECLGDLARYRMAIEDEKETHAQWGSVAASWYSIASDRHPTVGRLNHHLGILERPSLRKYFYYAKSLTCVLPFPNAQDSLSTLCGPIIKDEKALRSSNQSAEARIVTFHALLFAGHGGREVEAVAKQALRLFTQLPSAKIRDIGVSLAVANVSALLQLGASTNHIWQLYSQSTRQSASTQDPMFTKAAKLFLAVSPLQLPGSTPQTHPNPPSSSIQLTFCYSCINEVLRCTYNDRSSQRDTLAFVHVMLVWLHSLVTLASRLEGQHVHTFNRVLGPSSFFWSGLAQYLNLLIQLERDEIIDTARLAQQAREGIFPTLEPASRRAQSADPTPDQPGKPAKPLAEDYLIHGLVWTRWYFPSTWFDGTGGLDGRSIESTESHKQRVLRVLWLGLFLAFHTGYLTYNKEQHFFAAPVAGSIAPFASFAAADATITSASSPISVERASAQTDEARTPASRSSTAQSATSEVEDGFTIIKNISKDLKRQMSSVHSASPATTWASIASTHPPSHVQNGNDNKKGLGNFPILRVVNNGDDNGDRNFEPLKWGS